MANTISVIMLTKNSGKTIQDSLKSLESFDEVIIIDNGSTDNTIKLIQPFSNVILYEKPFIGFGPLKNLALSYTKNDWVLCVDSDEVLSQALIQEISSLSLNQTAVYEIQRENYYHKKRIQACGWQNDFVGRLFNKNVTQFNDASVHEKLILNGSIEIIKLHHKMKHYTFDNAEELLNKMQHYSSLWAQQNRGKKKSSVAKALLRSLYCFIKNYFFQRGFLYGYEGFVISVSNANGVLYKYLKLYELNRYEM